MEPSGISVTNRICSIPLLRNGEAIGSISLSGSKTGGFTDSQVELLKTFAEQAVIAIGSAETYRELQARTAALAERNSEYGERIEQQAATIDVLKAMSASPGDAQPVFDLIARRARELCNAHTACGSRIRRCAAASARHGPGISDDRRRSAKPRTVPDARRPATSPDWPRDPEPADQSTSATSSRSAICTTQPYATTASDRCWACRCCATACRIGVVAHAAVGTGGFSDSQVELLQTFAEQAVIAIGSAETYRALQERTAALAERNSEYGERIEQQSATIDVLKVMSASPGDPQPVFDLIVRRAQELCNGTSVGLFEFDGALIHIRASYGADDIRRPIAAFAAMFPMAPTRESSGRPGDPGQAIVHVRDMDAEPGFLPGRARLGREIHLSLPLLRDGVPSARSR